jgi:hypothetical protein
MSSRDWRTGFSNPSLDGGINAAVQDRAFPDGTQAAEASNFSQPANPFSQS